jgi:tetratricopeptide (TPR) repeat protein
MSRKILVSAMVLAAVLATSCRRDTADEHFAKANSYVEQSQLPEAILEYRAALQIDPKRGDIRMKLADALVRTRDWTGALREYVRAADVLPNDVNAQVKSGSLLLMATKFEDAKTRAKAALALDANNVEAMVLLGNAMAGLKDVNGAIDQYQEAIALNPGKDTAYLNLGVLQAVQGQTKDAEATFRKAISSAPKSMSARTALASFLWSAGRAPEAEATLKEALTIDPDHFAANRALGIYYLSTGRAAEAEPYFKRLAAVSKTTAASISLADYYIAANRPDEAKKLLTELATNSEAFAPATLRLASLEAAQGNRAIALDRVREVVAKNPKDMSARLLESRLLFLSNKIDESLTTARAIIKEEPSSASAAGAHMLIGGIEASRERNEEAIKSYEEALRLDRQPISAQLALAGLHLSTGDVDKAAGYVQQALSVQPTNPLGRSLLVRIDLLKGQSSKAAADLASLEKDYPNAAPVLNLVAARHAVDRRYDLARAAYAKVLQVSPNDLEALAGLVNIDLETKRPADAIARIEAASKRQAPNSSLKLLAARTYFNAGDVTKAEATLKECIDLDPNRISAYSLLGELYARQNKLQDAKDQFAKVVEKSPKSIGANTMLGMLLESLQDLPAAEQQYLKTLSANPNAAVAANNLAWIYASSNRNLDQAMELALTAYRNLPDNPNVNDTLGWIYYRKGLYPQAIRHLETATRISPKDPNNHYHLGMARLQTGDLVGGKASLTQALALSSSFEGADEARKALGGK